MQNIAQKFLRNHKAHYRQEVYLRSVGLGSQSTTYKIIFMLGGWRERGRNGSVNFNGNDISIDF